MCHKTIAKFIVPIALIVPHCLQAAAGCGQVVAKVASAQGIVVVRPYQSKTWQRIYTNDQICSGSAVRTLLRSRATLIESSLAVLTMDEHSTLTFTAPPAADKVSSWFIDLLEGKVFFRSREPQQLDIHTPFINAVHKGTEFMVAVNSRQAEITVFDGKVVGENSAGKITIDQGFIGIAQANRTAQVQVLKIAPEDAVQWALYYPPIIDDSGGSGSPPDNLLSPAIMAFRQGDSNQALSKLDSIPATQQTNQYFTLKAALFLSVGRVDEAQTLIRQAQQHDPNNADGFALQAVIAVAKNQQQNALELANKAVAAKPNSPVAKIAQSYAYQALFNIDEALKATQEATDLAPKNALAWARLAELQLSKGDHDAALKSAKKARALNPKLARTQTIVGFADLAETDISEAKQAFEQALSMDSSDPLARLGLGLAKIRKGELEEGKTELETAVNLDPNNAVIRSYLGKAYYELRNKDYAGTEFKIAKEMDPKDPTPYFYDAILKQTTNRPVEALHDMQKAIKLNDNRGVYRSKLLLDSDSAARSASLGRIYNDLGFQQRGLLEGWNSINNDPSNYSAHRLLADNYAALPRHEVSRLSELLKAQLLQPVNITPVQPQVAESNILILDGLGSSITSFNEYNPLFTRNRLALQASGFYGSHDTISDEAVQSGVWDKFSYSLGQFHYQTDGFRPNNDQKKDIYNFFAQAEITKDTNLQVELRRSEHDYGDINQSFYADKFSELTKGNRDSDIIRGGLHHVLSENSDLLMSIVHREEKSRRADQEGLIKYDNSIDTTGTQYELQHIYRHTYFDLTAGMNYLINQNGSLNAGLQLNPSLPFPINIDVRNTTESEHGAFYLYSNIKVVPELLMTVGVSQDFYRQTESSSQSILGEPTPMQIAKLSQNPINPKFGLTWTPTRNTTFRFAAFRSLKRGIIQKQTLEPTQVAGFNQFYDDVDGSIAHRIGFGIDNKMADSLFVGAEISKRFLEIPIFRFSDESAVSTKTNWNEENARGYINWTPNDFFAAGIEYSYEKFARNSELNNSTNNNSDFFTSLESQRVQIFGSFFHPCGFISKLRLANYNQFGNFKNTNTDSGVLMRGSSNFWLLDAELGYRLPKRHGLISFGIKNLLDEHFNYQSIDANQPSLTQGRFIYGRATLSF